MPLMSLPTKPFKTSLRLAALAGFLLCVACTGCNTPANGNLTATESKPNVVVPKYGYQIVNIWPHDSNAFTQGLILMDGKLLESTGQEGFSSLRRVELESGKVLQKVNVPEPYFAEGITQLNGKVYQLTWQHNLGFIYDLQTFNRLGQFNYQGEGWGLTTDGQSLILSDGSPNIRFIDPTNFKVTRTINVTDQNRPIREL